MNTETKTNVQTQYQTKRARSCSRGVMKKITAVQTYMIWSFEETFWGT